VPKEVNNAVVAFLALVVVQKLVAEELLEKTILLRGVRRTRRTL
jgi:hypothetical protein